MNVVARWDLATLGRPVAAANILLARTGPLAMSAVRSLSAVNRT